MYSGNEVVIIYWRSVLETLDYGSHGQQQLERLKSQSVLRSCCGQRVNFVSTTENTVVGLLIRWLSIIVVA